MDSFDSSQMHLERAIALIEISRYESALDELNKAIAITPDNAGLHALVSNCLVDLERLDDAMDAACEAIRHSPDEPCGYVARSLVHLNRREWDDAIEAAEEAIALDPECENGWAAKTSALIMQADWPKACAAARRAYELATDDADAATQYAVTLMQTGREDEANTLLERALQLDPECSTSHLINGWFRVRQGDFSLAEDHYREAIRLDPVASATRAGMLYVVKNRWFRFRSFGEAIPLAMAAYLLLLPLLVLGLTHNIREMRGGGEFGWERDVVFPLFALGALAIVMQLFGPYADLVVYATKFGRPLLSRRQIQSALVTGVCSLLAAGCVFAVMAGAHWKPWLPTAIGALFFSYLFSETVSREGMRKWLTGALAITVLVLVAGSFSLEILGASWASRGWCALLAVGCGCALLVSLVIAKLVFQVAKSWKSEAA